MSNMLEASFEKRFASGATVSIDHFELKLGTAEVTVLFGPSGSGKTTVLRCLAGLEHPERGVVRCANIVWFDAASGRSLAARHRNVGFVPQDAALFPHLTIEENIAYGLHDLSHAERRERVKDALVWLGLEGMDRRRPDELSGGQQQRVALARAVVRRPGLLLLDEPFSALDTPTRQRLRSDLLALLHRTQMPTIFVTHDRMEAAAVGDRVVVLHAGRALQSGAVADVFNRPVNIEAARVLGTDTIVACDVEEIADGLVTLRAGVVRLTALAEFLPVNARRAHVCIRAEDVMLTTAHESAASPRNQFAARVLSLDEEGPLVKIELDCGFVLRALLTRQACAELNLHPGTSVVAMIKAPHVHVVSHETG